MKVITSIKDKLARIIDDLARFANDNERVHEHFNIWHHAFIYTIIATPLAVVIDAGFVWAAVGILNLIRVTYQEIKIERGWNWGSAIKDPDWYYDNFMRPVMTSYYAAVFMFAPAWLYPLAFLLGYVGSYKYKIFERKSEQGGLFK